MKREEQLLRAIGDVDDELIASALELRRKKHPAPIRWAAAACLCLMLTVTAGAAKWGVEWWHGEYEPYEQYTVDWKYPLAPVTVRQEAIAELERWLLWSWGVDGRDEESGLRAMQPDTNYIGAYLHGAEKIRTVADLEDYLGIELTTSPQIDADCLAVREKREASGNRILAAIDLIALTELICDAEIEYAETGKVSLGGIEVDLDLGYLGTNCKARMKIFIPLTQNFVDDFPAKDWWFASVAGPSWTDYENGQFEVEELEISGKEVVVFSDPVNDLEKCPTALAVYSDNGIGYYIYCMAEDWEGYENHENVYAHGRDRLMELLENLE